MDDTIPGNARASTIHEEGDASALASAMSKAGWRLMPLLILAFVINGLDRTNVGFAALTMKQDLGLTATQFGYGAGLLFVTYCLLEIPSNLAMYRFGASRWLARILVSWGILAAATGFVVGPTSFYVVRLLLGAAEAGFTPGVVFLLTLWFPNSYRTRMMAWFMAAIPLSSMVGGPLSVGLLQMMNGVAGLAGWRWMFIIEGLPATVLGFAFLLMLADEPRQARWLSPVEKRALQAALAVEHSTSDARKRFLPALRDARMYILALALFGITLGSFGIVIWLPQMLKMHSVPVGQIGWLSAIPYLFGTLGMLLWSWLVDRRGHRIRHTVTACILAGVALAVSTMFGSLAVLIVAITAALIGISAGRSIFWTIPSLFLAGQAAAGGLALINCVGAFGGFVGPYMMGVLVDRTGSFEAGITALATVLVLSAFLLVSLRIFMQDR